MKKFTPKIPPKVEKQSLSESNALTNPDENIIVIRVKRRINEPLTDYLVVGRGDANRASKRFMTAEHQLSRLTVDEDKGSNVNQSDLKTFKFMGTLPLSETFLKPSSNFVAAPEISQKLLMKISSHCRSQQDSSRNVKSDCRESTTKSRVSEVASSSKSARATSFRRARMGDNPSNPHGGLRVIDVNLQSSSGVRASSDPKRDTSANEAQCKASEQTLQRRRQIEAALDKIDEAKAANRLPPADGLLGSKRPDRWNPRGAVVDDDDGDIVWTPCDPPIRCVMDELRGEEVFDYYCVDSAAPPPADRPVVMVNAPGLWDDDEWSMDSGEDQAGPGEDESDSNAEDHPDNDYPDEPEAPSSALLRPCL